MDLDNILLELSLVIWYFCRSYCTYSVIYLCPVFNQTIAFIDPYYNAILRTYITYVTLISYNPKQSMALEFAISRLFTLIGQ